MPQSPAIIGIKDTSKTNPILWDNQKNDGLKGQKSVDKLKKRQQQNRC